MKPPQPNPKECTKMEPPQPEVHEKQELLPQPHPLINLVGKPLLESPLCPDKLSVGTSQIVHSVTHQPDHLHTYKPHLPASPRLVRLYGQSNSTH